MEVEVDEVESSTVYYGTAEKSTKGEDFSCNITNGKDGSSFFSIFDGHGGRGVASYLAENLYKNIVDDENWPDNIEQAIINGFHKTNAAILSLSDTSGSTATVVLLHGEKVWVAYVGDSLAYGRTTEGEIESLSDIAHKPSNPDEKQRVTDKGATIDGNYISHPNSTYSVNMTRAFGDESLAKYDIIIATPTIECFDRKNFQYIAIGSDGLWDMYKPYLAFNSITNCLMQHLAPNNKVMEECATKLCNKAHEEWLYLLNEMVRSKPDDITATVLYFIQEKS